MEADIKKLLEYVETGPQNLIVMSSLGSKLHTQFNPPLEYNHCNVGYELCLIRLEAYFSFPNIGPSNNSLRVMMLWML